jgi:nitrogen fixation protein FixH
MKFNWGTGIAIFYGLFVLVLVIAVIRSTGIDNSLVTDDYYQKDLEYQTQIDKQVNARGLSTDLAIRYSDPDHAVQFSFPKDLGAISGKILFFRPSNAALDFETDIQTDENFELIIPTRELLPGLWKVKVDWSAGGRDFYKEETIIF